MSDDPSLDELKEATQSGDRITDLEDAPDLDSLMDDAFAGVDSGRVNKTLSVWDPKMAATVAALESDDETLAEAITALQVALGRDPDPDDADRSELLRLALRVGLQEAAPEVLDTAKRAHTRQTSDSF